MKKIDKNKTHEGDFKGSQKSQLRLIVVELAVAEFPRVWRGGGDGEGLRRHDASKGGR